MIRRPPISTLTYTLVPYTTLFRSDILLYGTLSNLPKLFGGDGASVYTRGDTNVRLPVVNMPSASTAARIYSGVTTGWDALVNSTEGLTAQQGAALLSNMLGNRALAGLLETFGD